MPENKSPIPLPKWWYDEEEKGRRATKAIVVTLIGVALIIVFAVYTVIARPADEEVVDLFEQILKEKDVKVDSIVSCFPDRGTWSCSASDAEVAKFHDYSCEWWPVFGLSCKLEKEI